TFIPNRLHAKLTLIQRSVHPQFDRKRLDRELRGPTQFTRTLRQNMKQSLFKPTTLIALPLLVVVGAEVNDVLARNVGWTTRRCEHLALHGRFHFARDLHQKLFPNASRFGVFVGGLQQVLAGLAVYPFSDRFKQPQAVSFSALTQSNFT